MNKKSSEKLGLKNQDLDYLKNYFSQFQNIKKVLVFGSRAIGNYKKGSDIDLAIVGQSDKNVQNLINKMSAHLNEESPMPYEFDLIDYACIDNLQLKLHIDEYGVVLYEARSWN